MKHFWIQFILLLILAAGCQQQLTTHPIERDNEDIAVFSPALVPDRFSDEMYHNLRFNKELFAFYDKRKFKPLWLENNKPTEKARSMLDLISGVRRYGLLPQDYHSREIFQRTESADLGNVLRLELLLSDALLGMANDLRRGRLIKAPAFMLDSLKVANLADSIITLSVKTVLESQEPKTSGYRDLRIALNNILDSARAADRTLLLKGMTDDSSAVHRDVRTIELNLERWRTESASLEGTYAWVNVPAYMFYVVENGKVVLESRVIVGKQSNETPRFSSNIECFTVFPYWYVPRKISVQEYLPALRKDTTFLTRNNFDVLDRTGKVQDPSTIDWKQLTPNNFPYTLRQREGKENSLGVLKFVFDNPYAVYVHDTNAKRLFNNKMRALSHGCIRLEKAYEFAHYLIDGRSKISSETLDKYLKTERKATVNLTPSVPIHIRYYTCEMKDGKLLIYDDIYRQDQKLIAKLYPEQINAGY